MAGDYSGSVNTDASQGPGGNIVHNAGDQPSDISSGKSSPSSIIEAGEVDDVTSDHFKRQSALGSGTCSKERGGDTSLVPSRDLKTSSGEESDAGYEGKCREIQSLFTEANRSKERESVRRSKEIEKTATKFRKWWGDKSNNGLKDKLSAWLADSVVAVQDKEGFFNSAQNEQVEKLEKYARIREYLNDPQVAQEDKESFRSLPRELQETLVPTPISRRGRRSTRSAGKQKGGKK